MSTMDRLFHPRSIAVLGGQWAENVIVQLDKIGFTGPIYPVHPTRTELAGRACLSSLETLDAPPDATFLGVNREATVDCVKTLSTLGAGGAVCFSSGWSERAEHALQQQLVTAAGDMPILGPNCYGFINYLDGVLLWPDQHGGRRVERGVAIVCQSSNIAINLSMQARGLPVAFIVCLGNAAQVKLADLLSELLADSRVTAVGIYTEGIDDPEALACLAETSRSRNKGMVALRSGRTVAGAAAAATHTAALSGDDAASRAFLLQAGIAEVATLDALVETLKILHVHGPLRAHNICAVTCSGGEAALVADLAENVLELPAPTTAQCAHLSAELGPLVSISNPLDYQTFLWGDLDATVRVFEGMLAGYEAGLFVIDVPRQDRCDPSSFEPALTAIKHASVNLAVPAFPVASLPENFGEARATALIENGLVPLLGLECAIHSVAAAATRPGLPGWRPLVNDRGSQDCNERPDVSLNERGEAHLQLLDEAQAKTLLSEAGIPVTRFVVESTLDALKESARSLLPPLVMKGLGFVHKSEAGAVRLNLATLEGQSEMADATAYLAEEMVTDGVAELLIGLRRTEPYGLSIVIGSGGTTAELLADTVTLIAPVTAMEVEAALQRLRLWPLLDGYRGRAPADISAAVTIILQLQTLAMAQEELMDVEINPLILRARGAVAVDAVIRRRCQ